MDLQTVLRWIRSLDASARHRAWKELFPYDELVAWVRKRARDIHDPAEIVTNGWLKSNEFLQQHPIEKLVAKLKTVDGARRYLRGIVRFQIKEFRRRRQREFRRQVSIPSYGNLPEEAIPAAGTPIELLLLHGRERDRQKILEILAGPDIRREDAELIDFYFFREYSYQEIAEILSEREKKAVRELAVRKRVSRAKQELQKLVDKLLLQGRW